MITIYYTMIISLRTSLSCTVHIKVNPSVSVLLFFWDSSAYWFSPRRSRLHPPTQPTRCRHRVTAVVPYCALLQKMPPQHVPPMDMELLYIILKLLFWVGIPPNAVCRPSAECRASQPRVGRAPSVIRHAAVRPCASFAVPCATSASPAASAARVSCPSYKNVILYS